MNLIANAHAVIAAHNARREPPDHIGQAIHDVDAAVMRLVELAVDYDQRKEMAGDRNKLRGSLCGLQLVCTVLEGV